MRTAFVHARAAATVSSLHPSPCSLRLGRVPTRGGCASQGQGLQPRRVPCPLPPSNLLACELWGGLHAWVWPAPGCGGYLRPALVHWVCPGPGGGTPPPLPVPAVRGQRPGLGDFGWAPCSAPLWLRAFEQCSVAAALSYSALRGTTLAGAITRAWVSPAVGVAARASYAGGSAPG